MHQTYLPPTVSNEEMDKIPPILPPEILRIVASYMDRHAVLALSMTSRFCARLFAGFYNDSWEVDCCSEFQKATIHGSNGSYNSINMDWFFQALKSGFAPAYANRVYFHFCMHTPPMNHAEHYSEGSLQTNWPLEQTGQFLKLLNASEIVVILKCPHGLGSICNAQFLRSLLRESLSELPNTAVKLRVDNSNATGLRPDSFYFTIRDSSTSQVAVADNIQRALRQNWSSFIDHDLWDAHELHSIRPTYQLVDIYPNVRYLSLSHHYDSRYISSPDDRVIQPEKYLTAFPKCERITYRCEKLGDNQCRETIFYFDNLPAQGRKCTKILVHDELFNWVVELLCCRLNHVKILEFHHAMYKALATRTRRWFPYTSETLNILLNCLLLPCPNLERMTLKFGMRLTADSNHPGTLSKEFCDYCELGNKVFEFDIRTMLREGKLNVVDRFTLRRLFDVGKNRSIYGAELSEFS